MTATGFFASHLASRDVARVIYGSIIGLALVVALQVHPPSAWRVAAILAGTAIAVGLAEVYSEVVGTETRTRRRVRLPAVRTLAGEAGAVAFGAGFPAAFFLLSALGVMEIDLAFTLSKWSGMGLIAGYGFVGARLAGADRRAALLEALAVGAIGGLLIGLKATLH
jgi:hypothetical protein